MKTVLIVYGTTDGHTKKIAQFIADSIKNEGCVPVLVDSESAIYGEYPSKYDAVIVAASVHAGGYQRSVSKWVKEFARDLNSIPSAFLSVCLGVLENKQETQIELKKIMGEFFKHNDWRPARTEMIAGAIPYSRYGWLKKRIMKRIAEKAGGGTDTSQDYEYTDWNALERFVLEFLAQNSLTTHEAEPSKKSM